MPHAPPLVMLISPSHFGPNAETAADNSFVVGGGDPDVLAAQAKREHLALQEALASQRVKTIVLPGTDGGLADELFLNNWFSTHDDAQGAKLAILYPLRWESRRKERRPDIIAALRQHYGDVLDLSAYETKGKYLEATGSLVFDGKLRRVYAARSQRTHEELVRLVADRLGYEPVIFDTMGLGGKPIYHTNVMMYLGTQVAAVCLDAIAPQQRETVARKIAEGREVITLTSVQVNEFAGNGFELINADGQTVLAMSDRAYNSLTKDQLALLKKHYGGRIVHPSFAAIEQGGGSVRCVLAALHTANPAGLLAAVAEECRNGETASLSSGAMR
jgi:hypothetical protein